MYGYVLLMRSLSSRRILCQSLTISRHPPLGFLLQLVCFYVEYAVLDALVFDVQAFSKIVWQSLFFLLT
jgi:hypothetical protein